jgi:hypothetical protein
MEMRSLPRLQYLKVPGPEVVGILEQLGSESKQNTFSAILTSSSKDGPTLGVSRPTLPLPSEPPLKPKTSQYSSILREIVIGRDRIFTEIQNPIPV